MEENKIKDDLDVVMDCVEKIFMIDQSRIRSKTRKMDAAFARHAYSVVCRDCTRRTYQEIGDSIDRDRFGYVTDFEERKIWNIGGVSHLLKLQK